MECMRDYCKVNASQNKSKRTCSVHCLYLGTVMRIADYDFN